MRLEHGHSEDEIVERFARVAQPGHLRDFVYGAIDGAVTTFAIVAGVVGADLPTRVIIALGFANVLADGFSMAAANYSGTKAEADNARRLREIEARHIAVTPEGERRELIQILKSKGLDGQVLEDAADAIMEDHKKLIDLMLVEEYGLAPADPRPMHAAVATFVAFMIAGLIPLMPFVIGLGDPFRVSLIATGCVFFGIGTLKSVWSLSPWWRSGLETLLIGGSAAAIAYFVGTLFQA